MAKYAIKSVFTKDTYKLQISKHNHHIVPLEFIEFLLGVGCRKRLWVGNIISCIPIPKHTVALWGRGSGQEGLG